jgi:hypothetical protein
MRLRPLSAYDSAKVTQANAYFLSDSMVEPYASTKHPLTTAAVPEEEAEAEASVVVVATTKMVVAVEVTVVAEDTVCLPFLDGLIPANMF